MDWDTQTSYKQVIRARVSELKSRRPGLTLKKIAEKIPLQYTYLSRVLNSADTHLDPDALFRVCELLEFSPVETEFVLTLQAVQSTQIPARKEFHFRRLEALRDQLGVRASNRTTSSASIEREMAYLFDPLCVVVWVALNVKKYREDPRLVASALGVQVAQLRAILKKLETVDFIRMEPNSMRVSEVKTPEIHFDKSHPLMRTHQYLLKLLIQERLLKTSEEQKESFQATFTSDAKALPEFRKELRKFVESIQKISQNYPSNHLFTVSLDLLHWF